MVDMGLVALAVKVSSSAMSATISSYVQVRDFIGAFNLQSVRHVEDEHKTPIC